MNDRHDLEDLHVMTIPPQVERQPTNELGFLDDVMVLLEKTSLARYAFVNGLVRG
jgi:hypothetical protein